MEDILYFKQILMQRQWQKSGSFLPRCLELRSAVGALSNLTNHQQGKLDDDYLYMSQSRSTNILSCLAKLVLETVVLKQ